MQDKCAIRIFKWFKIAECIDAVAGMDAAYIMHTSD